MIPVLAHYLNIFFQHYQVPVFCYFYDRVVSFTFVFCRAKYNPILVTHMTNDRKEE